MNLASLFNLQGPDLFLILLIVLLISATKRWPGMFGESGDSENQAEPEDRRSIVNRVLGMFVVIAAVILLSVLWSRL